MATEFGPDRVKPHYEMLRCPSPNLRKQVAVIPVPHHTFKPWPARWWRPSTWRRGETACTGCGLTFTAWAASMVIVHE